LSAYILSFLDDFLIYGDDCFSGCGSFSRRIGEAELANKRDLREMELKIEARFDFPGPVLTLMIYLRSSFHVV
jgi:hypothetical protein